MAEVVPANAFLRDASHGFHLIPSRDAIDHPVNRALAGYKSFPPLDFLNVVQDIKPWALVLAKTREDGTPVILAGDVGKGKVILILTNSLWQYAFSSEALFQQAYTGFWNNALRWVSGEPDMSNISLELPRENISPGEVVKLNVGILNKQYQPIKNNDAEISVVDIRDGKSIYQKRWNVLSKDNQIEFKPENEGAFRVILTLKQGERIVDERETTFVIKDTKGEMDSPFSDDELLRMLAEGSGGEFYKLSNRLSKIKIKKEIHKITGEEKRVPLWNSFYIYFTLLLILVSEWFLRRRWGLR